MSGGHNKVGVVSYKDDIEVKRYNSIQEAYMDLGVDCSDVSKCCRGIRKRVGGYEWRYTE